MSCSAISKTFHYISIHALHEESDKTLAVEYPNLDLISIHALHEESDPIKQTPARKHPRFQSTLSMRRATAAIRSDSVPDMISIHALHEESDCYSADSEGQY